MGHLDIKREGRLLADLLYNNGYNGIICFDDINYDNEEDIPHLWVNGNLFIVASFKIDKKGVIVEVWNEENESISIDLNKHDYEYYDNIGLFTLFQDVYYETKESWEIGDYEMDFLDGE